VTTLLVVLAAYALFVVFVLAILAVAKHADELAERWHGELPAASRPSLPRTRSAASWAT
jgi:hypothetical protein